MTVTPLLDKFQEALFDLESKWGYAKPQNFVIRGVLYDAMIKELAESRSLPDFDSKKGCVLFGLTILPQKTIQSVSFFSYMDNGVHIPIAYLDEVSVIIKMLDSHDYANIPLYAVDLSGEDRTTVRVTDGF